MHLCVEILPLITQTLNIPLNVCYIKEECESSVVQVLRRGCINHAK